MWAVLGLLLGILIGMFLPFQIPLLYARYTACAFLAALDSVLGATRAGLEHRFDFSVFISGFITNTLLAGLLTLIGDRLGVELYLVAILTFGMRIFENLTHIRLDIILGSRDKRKIESAK